MPIEDMREEEIFATDPVVPNASPTDEEIATGFLGGAAPRPFFNSIWNRFSAVLFKVQNQSKEQKASVILAEGQDDVCLVYKDLFIGPLGADAVARTPIKGSPLRNDSGLENNKYVLTGDTTIVRKDNERFPLYTACGASVNKLILTTQISTRITQLSKRSYPDADFAGVCLNCIGAYERIEIVTGGPNVYYRVYDTTGAIIAEAATTIQEPGTNNPVRPSDGDVITLKVSRDVSGILVEIPEFDFSETIDNFFFTTGSIATPTPVSEDHGLICTPQTVAIENLIIRTA